MTQPKRRVSYIIPPQTSRVPRLRLPGHGLQRLGAVGPLLVPYDSQDTPDVDNVPLWARHPRHRLGVSSLALDSSTQLAGHGSPNGILYSGGRDGLIMAWDLGIPLKKRKLNTHGIRSPKSDQWEHITGWADDSIEEEGEDEERIGTDGDILGDVTDSSKRARKMSSTEETAFGQQWEANMTAFKPDQHSEFRQCAQAHSDWINDILLCNSNQTVISASSDGTIKAWDPHSTVPSDPSIVGSHSDYVRCLSLCREQNWVASGSFDRTIKLWDITRTGEASASDPLVTLNPADASAPKSSVYAIAADPYGRTVASGSPERVVRLWDPRSAKRTGKLVGHTDNIRAILISEDSRYLLTGSADASIKLWSLASQRCLHTFTHHTESVWSLHSSHPNLETFYSGDRCGQVCRVDIEDCGDLSEGECILLCNDSDAPRPAMEGINRIEVLSDNLLWTATGTSTIKRWQIPPKRSSRIQNLPVFSSDGEKMSSSQFPLKSRRPPVHSDYGSQPNTRPSTGQDSRDRGFSFDNTLHGIPFEHLIKLISPNDSFTPLTQTRHRDPEVATLYSAASIMSVHRGNGTSRLHTQNSFQFSHGSPLPSSRTEDTMMATNTARLNYEERELASDATPYCAEPSDVLVGEDGLVRSIILSDRIHALTVDTSGEVAVWDIVRGICLGKYLADDVASASNSGSVDAGHGEMERSPREALEAVRERIEGEAAISAWCTADTKAGVLTIHLTERCFDSEVYADEVGFSHDKYYNDETKLNVGKWVLRNLFMGFIREELHLKKLQEAPGVKDDGLPPSGVRSERDFPRSTRHRHSSSLDSNRRRSRCTPSSSSVINSPKMIPAVPPVITNLPRSSPLLTPLIPLHSLKEGLAPIMQSPPSSPIDIPSRSVPHHQRTRSGTADGHVSRTPSTGTGTDYFATRARQQSLPGFGSDDIPGTPGTPKAEIPTPTTPGGLMGRLKSFGKSSKRPVSDTASPALGALAPATETLATADETVAEVPKTPMQVLLAGPLTPPGNADAPLHPFPSQTIVLITEEATPAYRVVYRGNVASMHQDVAALEDAMPMWLAEYLLLNKIPPSTPLTKLSFILLPWSKDPDVEPLPELLNTAQSKLTASRYLRVSKILQHVQDKLEKMAASELKHSAVSTRLSLDHHPVQEEPTVLGKGKPEDQYEVLCNDTLLPLDMTLAAVRQFVWRQSGELVMHYRRKIPRNGTERGDI